MTEKLRADDVFSGIQIDAEQRKQAKNIGKRQMELEEQNEKNLTDYEKSVKNIISGDKTVDVQELSKLDDGIQRGKEFKNEISDLTESLTKELTELGQFFGDLSQYRGIEKLLYYIPAFGIKWADKARLKRVKSSDVKQNLESILDYGVFMVGKLNDAMLENIKCHTQIDASIQKTTDALVVNQPLYEKWRADKERLTRKQKELQDKIDTANETEVAALEKEKSKLDIEVQKAAMNEDHYFTIASKAKEAIPMQRKHLQAYADTVKALDIFKTGLEQQINHVTHVYLSVPIIIKTALGVKAASQYDKGMKYATDMATDTVLKSAAGVLDEVATRTERPLIEPEKLKAYGEMQAKMRAEFNERQEAIKKKYAAPARQAEAAAKEKGN